ncbi:MAG: universal stress protein [Hyphomicrobiales bacterium]|nr:universal stress protein [Hyphomicrobiales bacterium]
MPAVAPAALSVSTVVSAPVSLARILVALDASDHANRGIAEAVRLAASAGGTITGIHAYAASLHDRRFRQMEGGLPERYRAEDELERQRHIHDSLITRGLTIIADSYHDAAEALCTASAVVYRRLSPEGKNYRRIAEAVAGGAFDVLVLGARGLGAGEGSTIGTVCGRVTRRASIDVLVIRDPRRPLGEGPLVVGIDGSPQSFGALRTAIDLGRRLDAPVHAVAVYDPHFHYVAFQRIAGVLSEEAGRVFRFKEQEKLHAEIIDDGIARIYSSHLAVARAIAQADGVEITTALLDGKPHAAITRYLGEVGASLVLVGKVGIHADAELDIGGVTENLLHVAPCHVWIGSATHTPPSDAVARETIVWSSQAEQKIARVPETVRNMVRMVILRYAQEQGHTVVTTALVDEATARFCPGHGSATIAPTCSTTTPGGESRLPWEAAALARLHRVPAMGRESVRLRAESCARKAGGTEVTIAVVEAALAESRKAMEQAMCAGGHRPGPHRHE